MLRPLADGLRIQGGAQAGRQGDSRQPLCSVNIELSSFLYLAVVSPSPLEGSPQGGQASQKGPRAQPRTCDHLGTNNAHYPEHAGAHGHPPLKLNESSNRKAACRSNTSQPMRQVSLSERGGKGRYLRPGFAPVCAGFTGPLPQLSPIESAARVGSPGRRQSQCPASCPPAMPSPSRHARDGWSRDSS